MPLLDHLEKTIVEEWNDFRAADTRETPNEELFRPLQNRILHAQVKSNLLHSTAHYLQTHQEEYGRSNGFEFQILQASLLHASYALREALFNLVNEVWDLGVDNEPQDWKSDVRDQIGNSTVDNVLGSLLAGTINNFLSEYRDPEAHDTTLDDVEGEDVAAAVAGNPQPRIQQFIDDCEEISEKFQEKERTIIEEAMDELNYV